MKRNENRKNRNWSLVVTLLVLCAMFVSTVAGCNKPVAENPAPSTPTSEVESEVVSEEVSEPVSEEPSEEVASEEVSEIPEIVDGVQILSCSSEEEMKDYYEKIENAAIAVFNFTFVEKGQALLYDGAYYTIEKDFFMTINSSKKIQTVNTQAEYISITNSVNDDEVEWRLFVDTTGTDIEVPLTITYEDGTEETLTVYITKDWKWSWEE